MDTNVISRTSNGLRSLDFPEILNDSFFVCETEGKPVPLALSIYVRSARLIQNSGPNAKDTVFPETGLREIP